MIVLDASALVDVVVDQPTKAWVLDNLQGQTLLAPAHQMAEVVSALARLVRAGAIDTADAEAAVQEAHGLVQEVCPTTSDQVLRALRMQDRVRVLDGLYVALAQDRGATLLTTDRRLARADLPITVLAPASD